MRGTAARDGRARVNLVLWVILILCGALAVALGAAMVREHRRDGGDTSGGLLQRAAAVVTDEKAAGEQSGATLGARTVTAFDEAPEEEQERSAAILETTSAMAAAFVNLDYRDTDAGVAAVRKYATGAFQTQYDQSAKGLVQLAKRAKSVMEGEVLWSAVVAADKDSATVLAATTGTVANKETDFKPQARNYRMQMELVLRDGLWLVRDLQFVA
ncbi:hypothetical protein [Nocardioides sp. YIM 152588]|uniref:hypothetical protein n=1 Tax=Nocardioides sp. YIM 152588 TaxID=3158259 RepID=UPI0032E445B7